MDRETARQTIREHWREIIPNLTGTAKSKANGNTSYICPLCGHGTHGDGLTCNPQSKDGNGLKCFGCDFAGDIIDLYEQANGTGYNETLSLLANMIGITIAPYSPVNAPRSDFKAQSVKLPTQSTKAATEGAEPPKIDFTEYYKQCASRMEEPVPVAYLQSRGISLEVAKAYGIGYDPKADPAKSGHTASRLIIPVTSEYYVARATDDKIDKRYKKMNPKGAPIGIFNRDALYMDDVQEVFVVEGVFDALSVMEAGATAIALNSTSNVNKLLKQLENKRTAATLILCLDNDEAGKKAADTLKTGLRLQNVSFIIADICGGYKDANEYLQHDRDGFFEAVQEAIHQNVTKPDNTSWYIDSLMGHEIEEFKSDTKTGYSNLDKESGGLYAGLYVLAAISSLGKTTFIHQMADQIAASGTDVLYFSLEQSRLEMVTKSLARLVAQENPETTVTSLSIRKGYLPQEVLDASKRYQDMVSDQMSVIEGNFNCNISFIGDYIRRYMEKNKKKPVVIIDYLQILQPEERNGRQQTAKETVDATVTELKRLSREKGLTIIAVSSVNRANYLTPIDFEALKESGIIEYTADVIWGLQLHCLTSNPVFDKQNNMKEKREIVQKEKAKSPREVDLVCLKNRYGIASYTCNFTYKPKNDLFEPEYNYAEKMPKASARRV